VYSQLTNEWKCIQDDAELQMALEVFSPTGDRLDPVKTTEAQTELEAFLLSTERIRSSGDIHQGDDASYESDHGTRYVKDYRTGKWIHEALMPTQKEQHAEKEVAAPPKKKKQKKAKFAARNARCWIYIAGLPLDTTEEQLAQIFAKAGILDLDPTTQRPKIKVYRHKDGHPFAGQCKGDASLCYARPESVALAITLLDETEYNGSGHTMRVQPAQFEQRGELDTNRNRISNAQRKVAKLAALQARDWDDSNSSSRLVGGRKGLRIIVLKHLFEPNVWKNEAQEDEFFAELERSLRAELEVFGVVEKITVFSQRAVVVVKLAQPSSASEVVKDWDGKLWKGRRVQAMYWDGVTDYTVRDDEKEQVETEQRLEEFGNWLDEQELPEELKLQKE
jgi:RNA recognition motif-containing protein